MRTGKPKSIEIDLQSNERSRYARFTSTDSSMDRVPGFEPGGWRFEPSSVHLLCNPFIVSSVSKISYLAQTESFYSAEIYRLLGKGLQQATHIYSQLMRYGTIDRESSHFKNCQQLIDSIEMHSELLLPELVKEHFEGETGKFLLRTHDNFEIETVRIPMQAGGTLCVSSQVGCRLGCAFCETGRMGLLRNLTTEEIVSQVFIAKHHLKFDIRNIVFMGMGEPFDNYDAVMQAVRVLTDPKGFGFGKTHITISTSGRVDGLKRFTEEPGETPNLAVSVTAPDDVLRNRLMPINRKYNLQQLYEAMLTYNQKTGRQILAAYVLLKDVNDTVEHADRLAEYLKGLSVKINVIPYNQQTHDRFASPESTKIDAFVERLQHHGYCTLRRSTKGQQIMAACGQLGNLKHRNQATQASR